MFDTAPVCLQARWLFPITGPPLRDGLITVAGQRIVAVGENRTGRAPLNLGNVALLPGLVNAHTHLEFSGLTEPLTPPGTCFTDWLRTVVEQRRRPREAEEVRAQRLAAVQQGLQEIHATGTALVGDIATPPWPQEIYAGADTAGVVFLEILGLNPARLEELCAVAAAHVQHAAEQALPWRLGLSPHAPYTVGPELLERLVELSAAAHAPVAMHLAESFAEMELLRSGSGPLQELLSELEAWYPGAMPRGLAPREYLEILSRAERALVIHGNFLSQEEIDFLGARAERMSVVYCPRTHARFVAGDYSLADLLAAGVNVALGTDSRATNPDLNIWREMQFLHARQAAPPETILRLGTQGGATALGLGKEYGALVPGRTAAFTAIALPPETSGDPYEEVIKGEAFPLATSLQANPAFG